MPEVSCHECIGAQSSLQPVEIGNQVENRQEPKAGRLEAQLTFQDGVGEREQRGRRLLLHDRRPASAARLVRSWEYNRRSIAISPRHYEYSKFEKGR